jgi:hypothetical protein
MKIKFLGLFIAILFFAGCSSIPTSYPYSHTSDRTYTVKSDDCKFKVLSALPSGTYEEIGVFNIVWGDTTRPSSPNELKAMIGKDLCSAGGDFVVGDVNGYGVYVRATLFKYTDT